MASAAKYGSVMSCTMSPTTGVVDRASAWAGPFEVYPRSAAARRTRSRRSARGARVPGCSEREAVARDTPAAAATSCHVTGPSVLDRVTHTYLVYGGQRFPTVGSS